MESFRSKCQSFHLNSHGISANLDALEHLGAFRDFRGISGNFLKQLLYSASADNNLVSFFCGEWKT